MLRFGFIPNLNEIQKCQHSLRKGKPLCPTLTKFAWLVSSAAIHLGNLDGPELGANYHGN